MKNPKDSNLATLEFELNVDSLVNRFKMGKIGKVYDSLVNDEEIQQYFEEKLLKPCQKKLSEMSEEVKKVLGPTFSTQNIWSNFSINLVNNIFRNAIEIWMDTGENLDEIIVGFADKEIAKKVIDILANSMTSFADNVSEISTTVRHYSEQFEMQQDMDESKNYFEEEKEDNVVSFFSKKSSKLLN